jgi:SAM-dependent methyltransferase
MADLQKNTDDNFYKHSFRDKPTRLGSFFVRTIAKKIFKFSEVKEGNSVLEIGPGRGYFARVCIEEKIKYIAIEPNHDLACDLTASGIQALQTRVPPLPKLEKKFDAVVMIHVIEHMDTMGQALELSKGIFDALNPGGKFVISSPDFVNYKYLFFAFDFSHNYVTSAKRLEGLLLSSGYGNIKFTYMSGPISGLLSFFVSGIAARLPLQLLYALFPKNIVVEKLLKIQGMFLRAVLISGEKTSS